MKNALTLILCLFTMTMQAQVVVSEQSGSNRLTIGQVLINKGYDSHKKSTLKLLTEEASVQIHNGKEVYQTIQDVEYTIKFKGAKISTKRKILSTKKESFCSEGQADKVCPNMTTYLLSSVLMPHTVNLDG